MEKKFVITICLGSSCFSRGNDETLVLIRQYLEEHKLNEIVDFRGKLCSCDCNNGPILHINGEKYQAVNQDNILNILDENLISEKIEAHE